MNLSAASVRVAVAPWPRCSECYRVADVWITAPDGAEYLLRAACDLNQDGQIIGRPHVSERGRLNRHTGRVVPSQRTARMLEPIADQLRAFLAP